MAALDPSVVVAVVGAGAMGQGIAQVAAEAGHPVLLYDTRPGAAEAAVAAIAQALTSLVGKDKRTAAARDAAVGRLRAAGGLPDLAGAGLVVEAIVEDLDVKRRLFAELEGIVGDGTILATNTSSLSVTAIGAGIGRPERLAGLHFFNPAPLMALVEVVGGLASDAGVLDTLVDTAKAWGKSPVRCRSTPGFIVNRVARPFYAEGLRLLQEQAADPATIDAVMREAGGFRMGPFELMDLIGHDVNFAVTRSVHAAYFGDPRFQPSLIQQELVEAGRLGRKSGRGFYDHAAGAAKPAPRTAEPGPRPHRVTVRGDLGPAAALAGLLREAGVAVEEQPGTGLLVADGVTLALTDGRTATARAAEDGIAPLVLFDLALDYAKAARVALAPADGTPAEAVAAAAGLFQALGKAVSVIDDAPAMVVMRTVAMLASEAADAVMQGVAGAADVDTAMTKGVNYPLGPLAWAERIGLPRVVGVLDALARTYGEDRYRASALLRRKISATQIAQIPSPPRGEGQEPTL
ncbi:3-hydroxyacyl-CoA dehydrogenase PaaH [Azospirillum picis]|uniref:3-hydroxybutyryl-CoA dehydrogenase n=1 Tax=Azospirillum picis TaxID=488438 RepID=A0ABU0MDE0_9PROT|nr:3-hydroxyacyl-CoA dehydrogenase PaaH [Azospirillum picis]MBP2297553.1 3-hydroxybutyryl-CoA dehydrogenase [Azospirillum picis]MDQ0531424.1 3-hydroxybutyryl-CoA dehydrogenase [Azospirillum picis]